MILEQRGTEKWPVRWQPHDNKIHHMEDPMWESNTIGTKN